MIEFDVLPEDLDGPRRRAACSRTTTTHDLSDAPTLEEGLAHLAGDAFAGVELDVDLKLPGYEERVVDALREHGLVGRALVSTQYMRSLVALRALEPGAAARLVGAARQARLHRARCCTRVPAYTFLLYAAPPAAGRRRRRTSRAGRCDAVMCHFKLVTPRARARRSRARAASCTSGRSTTRAGSARSRRSASPA